MEDVRIKVCHVGIKKSEPINSSDLNVSSMAGARVISKDSNIVTVKNVNTFALLLVL